MTTFLFFFHIGRVECVTFQEPDSHVRVGGGSDGDCSVEERVDGQRRVTILTMFGCMQSEFEV
jgi:hypothetical protein